MARMILDQIKARRPAADRRKIVSTTEKDIARQMVEDGELPNTSGSDTRGEKQARQLDCIVFCDTMSYLASEESAMTAASERKEYPISMRLPEADVAMIDRAASLRGRSRTDFVRDAAVRAAEEVVMENRLIRMSPEGFSGFMEILSRPAAAVPEMVELTKRPAPWDPGYVAKR